MRAPARLRWRPTLGVILPVSMIVTVTIALAWNAWTVRREHREAAEATVRDYATFAAELAALRVEASMDQVLLYAFYGADLAERGGSTDPVPPRVLATNPAESERCASHYPEGRWYVRVGPDGESDVHGPLPAGLGRWLADTLVALQRRPDAARYGNLFPAAGGARVIAYRLRRDEDGRAVEAHALAHCFEDGDGPVFEAARRGAPLLPPTAAPGSDSLLSLTVTDPTGGVLYEAPSPSERRFQGVRPPDPAGAIGGLTFSAVVPAVVAEDLVAGGIPGPGSGMTWILALLAGGLGLATVLQVHRSLSLVRARERFVANVSHELRTPLQLMLLYAQLLRMGQARAPVEREQAVGIIERETRRLIALVERVLSFAGPDRGASVDGERDLAGLGAVTRATVEAFRPMAEAEGMRVELDLPQDLPGVRVPSGPFHQVLLNLLDNAVRHGPPGQRVVVRAVVERGRVDLMVEDQGPGIPPAERERLWKPFERLDRSGGGDGTGSGIGLAVVREAVEAMGGQTWIEDAPDRGARVVIRLPLAPSPDEGGPS